ncbi:hypothetical protein HO133_001573 [Letharia lupina]|uniref:Uncharacterized protein n=1 Tax=Letharia lupina TaxID=560253 RepID=A0A8H6CDS8_9LECA|nr:uncharacterized protein HO133_001573 [Letharia lupina]KAF6221607.1 hypothetical protein HO133_001573 [Letharia lupina]
MVAPNPTGVYWASAANPGHGVCSFAIAASSGSILLRENEDEWALERSQCIQGQHEAVAVDWLGTNVVLKGCREGAIRLWDTRSGAESAEPRIQHTSAINHTRSIDENFIVVAGLQNELCTYDIRYAKRASPAHATQPYDRFPAYRNNALNHLSIGLDLHRNLVAAATDDGRVQIFDVKKGVELECRIKNLGANAACVRFVDEQRSGNGLKLMVAAGPRIDGWAFEGPGDRDIHDRDTAHYCT